MELEQWKQKYYDQLDRLEKKEQDWEKLESTLKRTIGRLSLAAEGQHDVLDKHIGTLRNAMKKEINRQSLESIVDDISRIISKLEEKENSPNRQSVNTLEQLLQKLNLPKSAEKTRDKLLQKFSKSDDDKRDDCLKKTLDLLLSVIETDTGAAKKKGIIDRLFSSDDDTPSSAIENKPTSSVSLADEQQLNTYKNCLLELLHKLDNPNSPSGKLSALKMGARDAQQKSELDKLSDQLSDILQSRIEAPSSNNNATSHHTTDASLQPSIQELLIRLLEQLIVPADLIAEADKMKHRLEQETDPKNWKTLLKEVALLINSIRSRMQKEKQEFENFLQQVTDRLKIMDLFLQNETSNLQEAGMQGQAFDKQIGLNVDEIRMDINQATELSNLKENVNTKLDTISGHIKLYRESEDSRFKKSQQEITDMHSKMQTLESETVKLKKLVVAKNKQAMCDALTEIPNRLAYEKKATEEIARWKRFSNPLSLAIWDIDLFKGVNDTYGHKAGDKVLKTIAQLLINSIRETDFLARYGGEEFVMLLPGTKQEETLRLVNKLREKIESCGFHYHGNAVKITASCGVSSFNENDTLTQVFERADKALYKAKDNGRNQCVVAACLSD
ncbi:diguanylate cyclase (GGDEF domain) [hydrothermal vent metagenome]|uniref:Diguanylate cyclase (GGDEF domain) n=1 Tax=hydrothermal vent metagenome TaxID=652676 RepID=A0A3B0XCF0_9ZZZZ